MDYLFGKGGYAGRCILEYPIIGYIEELGKTEITVSHDGCMIKARILPVEFEILRWHEEMPLFLYVMESEDKTFWCSTSRYVFRYVMDRLTCSMGIGALMASKVVSEIGIEALEQSIINKDPSIFSKLKNIGVASGLATKLVQELRETGLPDYYDEAIRELSVLRADTNSAIKEIDNHGAEETKSKDEGAIGELLELIGLDNAKKEIQDAVNFAKVQMQRKKMGLPETPVSFHLVFSGNPGTGKTTVARIVAKVYKEIGILSKGHLVETDRAGLVAGYVGQTAKQTKEIIEKAKGGVLFIDEAYTLLGEGKDFGQEAIDTLLKEMEDNRDDLVVIVAGYADLMQKFISSNPGLQSRFSRYIHFEDYNGEQLFQIFEKLCEKSKYKLEEGSEELLKLYFNDMFEDRSDNFGNARDVRNFFEGVLTRQANRLAVAEGVSKDDFETIKIVDLNIELKNDDLTLEKMLHDLNEMVGLSQVKKEVESLTKLVQYNKMREEQGLVAQSLSLHLVFTGNPGTGKTTVARFVAQIYKELGLLSKGQLIETDRAGLVAGYVGQTAIKTKEVISSAIGGVLFIDEAYTLLGEGNDFGQEAIDTLLKEMEDHRDDLVVIVAGYTDEMKSFIHSNPGLESRFNRYLEFDDYTPQEMYGILQNMCEKNQYTIADGAQEILEDYFKSTSSSKIGNGRGVRNIFEKLVTSHANDAVDSGCNDSYSLSEISVDDAKAALN